MWTNDQKERQMKKKMDIETDTHRQTDTHTYTNTHRHTQTDTQTETHTCRQTDTQTNRERKRDKPRDGERDKNKTSRQYLQNTKILAATPVSRVIFVRVQIYVLLWVCLAAAMINFDPLTETPSGRTEVPSPSNHSVQA